MWPNIGRGSDSIEECIGASLIRGSSSSAAAQELSRSGRVEPLLQRALAERDPLVWKMLRNISQHESLAVKLKFAGSMRAIVALLLVSLAGRLDWRQRAHRGRGCLKQMKMLSEEACMSCCHAQALCNILRPRAASCIALPLLRIAP